MDGNMTREVLPSFLTHDSQAEGTTEDLANLVWEALKRSSDRKVLDTQHESLQNSRSTRTNKLIEPVNGSRIRVDGQREASSPPDGGANAVYSLIGQKCVALGLDLASRIFAQSLSKILEQELDQQMSKGQIALDPTNGRQFIFASWREAWERGQATKLEQAIAQALEALPSYSQSVTTSHTILPAPPYPNDLTTREVEVLRLLAGGLTNTQLASRLFLSVNTVRAHLYSIFGKLDVNTRGEAARFAIEHNLVA